jgi:hypothetical protein
MEKELKEYISDFKEALELLDSLSCYDNISKSTMFQIEELLFRQKKRDRDGFTPDDLSTYSVEAFEELEDSLARSQDEVDEWKDKFYELREDMKDALDKYL